MIRIEQKSLESSSKLIQNKSESFLRKKFLSQLVFVIFVLGACARAGMTVRSPAEIDTRTIRNVAVGKFEVGLIQEKIKTERNGNWTIRTIPLSEEQKSAISRAVRARVVNLLGSTPYFQLNFSDEFAQLENDAALQQLVSVQGYTTENIPSRKHVR